MPQGNSRLPVILHYDCNYSRNDDARVHRIDSPAKIEAWHDDSTMIQRELFNNRHKFSLASEDFLLVIKILEGFEGGYVIIGLADIKEEEKLATCLYDVPLLKTLATCRYGDKDASKEVVAILLQALKCFFQRCADTFQSIKENIV